MYTKEFWCGRPELFMCVHELFSSMVFRISSRLTIRPHIKDIFQSIAAKADGEACCDWVGPDGAGHYVKVLFIKHYLIFQCYKCVIVFIKYYSFFECAFT
jgi:hypothetical protein